MFKDSLLVLSQSSDEVYLVSEYTWDSDVSESKELNVSKTKIRVLPDRYKVVIFPGRDFICLSCFPNVSTGRR